MSLFYFLFFRVRDNIVVPIQQCAYHTQLVVWGMMGIKAEILVSVCFRVVHTQFDFTITSLHDQHIQKWYFAIHLWFMSELNIVCCIDRVEMAGEGVHLTLLYYLQHIIYIPFPHSRSTVYGCSRYGLHLPTTA